MIKDFSEIVKGYFTPEENKHYIGIGTRGLLIKEDVIEEHSLSAPEQARLEFTFMNYQHAKEKGKTYKVEAWEEEYFKKLLDLAGEAEALYNTARDRYKEARKREGILEDIAFIVEAYTKEDYLTQLSKVKKAFTAERLSKLPSEKMKEEFSNLLGIYSEENYSTCFSFCFDLVEEPIMQLLEPEDIEEAIEIIKARVDTFGYERTGVFDFEDQLTEPELPELPKYDFVYPEEYQQNLTKATYRIFDGSISLSDLKQRAIEITPRKGGLITYAVYVDLSAPELKGTENITEFDKSVHNMAVSIGRTNSHGFFTARELATALIHGDNPNNNRVSPQQIGAVTKSIEKQRHIDITIDWTDHIKLNNKGNLPEDAGQYIVKDYMLPVREFTATIGGKTLHGYQFLDTKKLTPLYQYAQSVGQLGQHPAKMLNIPINLDQTKIVLRDFLLEEIAHMKNPKSGRNHTISVDRLLKLAGEDSQTINRTKKKRLLEAVEEMLTYWATEEKDQKGNIIKEAYIKGFTKNKATTTGSPLQSFTIDT